MGGTTDACYIDCPDGCAICINNSISHCSACTDDSSNVPYFLEIDQKGCEDTCPSGYYGDLVTHECTRCDSSCTLCSVASDNCTSCGMLLGKFTYLFEEACYTVCPQDGFYEDTVSFVCEPCGPGCVVCQGSTSNCSSCQQDVDTSIDYFKHPTENKCVQDCPSGYFQTLDFNCVECTNGSYGDADMSGQTHDACTTDCPDGCGECSTNFITECTKCSVDSTSVDFFLELDKVGCSDECPIGYYGDLNTHECTKCHQSCYDCDILSTNCTICGILNARFTYLYNDTCYNVCPDDGYYENEISFECLTCDPGCATC